MINFILEDLSEVQMPKTLMIDSLVSEPEYSIERAPYSNLTVVAGDGLPRPEPRTIKGKAYFDTAAAAESWITSMTTWTAQVRTVEVDTETITVHRADFVAMPVLLPRILNVTIRIYPKVVQ